MSLEEFCDLYSVDALNRKSAAKFFSQLQTLEQEESAWMEDFLRFGFAVGKEFRTTNLTQQQLTELVSKSLEQLKQIAIDSCFDKSEWESLPKQKLLAYIINKNKQK